jgi:predicted ATP-grasp superfamily ATP-dependent carboligase
LAAVRNLSANGFEVGVVASNLLSGAAWSRWASARYWAPPETSIRLFLERLIAIGEAKPGQILLPTSDETAWLYAANADVLKRYFCLYQPPLATIHNILDKKRFEVLAANAGLPILPSWHPRSIEELKALIPDLPYPILIKPRTQVHRLGTDKGSGVYGPNALLDQYQHFVDRERDRVQDNNPLLADAYLPILQKFVNVGCEGVLSVTGFIDQTRKHFVTRYSTKVVQRSHPVGVGVCFENRREVSQLSDAVRRLCNDLGYFGIFEIEFLWFNGSWVAIDFNPRLFHQIGMDIHRGMPLPLLACLDAAGDTEALHDAMNRTQEMCEHKEIVFCDRFLLGTLLLVRSLAGQLSRQDRRYWRSWRKRHMPNIIDAAADWGDPVPGAIHVLSEIQIGLRVLRRRLLFR